MAAIAAGVALGACVMLSRMRYRRSMTCHFCNRYAGDRLPSALPGSWYCPFDDCGQYNGFSSNGDYDRLLPELSDPAYNFQFSRCQPGPFLTSPSVLCSQCQCEQGLKVRALARSESAAEAAAIEKRFKLCSNCKGAVSNRLKTVNQRIRCSYTPLQISNKMDQPSKRFTPSILYLLIDAILIWQASIPLCAMLQLPIVIPFSSIPLMASLSNREYFIAAFKLLASAVEYRHLFPYFVICAADAFLTLSLHGFLTNVVSIELPTFACQVTDSICTYRLWTVIVRCAGVVFTLLDLLRKKCTTRSVIRIRPPVQLSPFDAPAEQTILKNETLSDTLPKQSVLSESGFKFSEDKLHDDLLAFEGTRSCDVEDLFAGISISRANENSESESVKAKQASSTDSYWTVSLVFAIAIVSFILNAKWAHWSISYLYTSSLFLLLAIGKRRPFTLPFTMLLLLRQCKTMSSFSSVIYDFLVQFGLDIAGLAFLGICFFVDWNSIIEKVAKRTVSAQEA